MYEGMIAETVTVTGDCGDQIEAYFARPTGSGPHPGVLVVHHMPGWDQGCKEITRKIAAQGYAAIMPNLHHRMGPGTATEMSQRVRESGGVPDSQFLGDARGAIQYLLAQPYSSGKVGIIGFCSGGRQVYIAACNIEELDAAVDCWGGRVVMAPEDLTEANPVSPLDMTPNMSCPLLGLFGEDDANPDPAQVATIEAALKEHGKTYEFHSYAGAGHAFFSVDRPAYRVEAAVDGWNKTFAWFEKHLGEPTAKALG